MGLSIEQMRTRVMSAYPGDRWKMKCHFMPDNQVVALYYKFLRTGKFDKKKKPRIPKKEVYHQMDIFDYI